MNLREQFFDRAVTESFDVAIIGGGATGLGAAVDAASRGLKTILLEQSDFAKGTSSRSTKLIHGGVRYLKQGNVSLVRESLHERGLLLQNAPGLVRPLEFIIPTFSMWERLFYATGLKMYDALSGRRGMARSRMLSTPEVCRRVPTIQAAKLNGGVSYFDAQFDDARLAIAMTTLLKELQGIPLNYVRAVNLLKLQGKVVGLVGEDVETGRQFEIGARSVINATGIFTDEIRQIDDPGTRPMLKVSRGSHLVVDRSFLPGETAIIIPSTDDGRVVFIIPWHGKTVIGTTDIPATEPVLDLFPLEGEIQFLLDHASRYLNRPVGRGEVHSTFCGLRPLVSTSAEKSTSKISRDHVLKVSQSELITITGGKWTTYRKMAQDTIDAAVSTAGLTARPSMTTELSLTGNSHDHPQEPQTAESVTEDFLRRSVHQEQARTIDDVLSRRCRLLLLDARAAIEVAPRTAAFLAQELGKTESWEASQIHDFTRFAEKHLP